jgi:hypothetical protein
MRRGFRLQLVSFLASGVIAVAAVLGLLLTGDHWYTPGLQGVGLLAAVTFFGIGARWTFDRLSNVHGD